MEGFETPKKMFTWLRVYPEVENTSELEKISHIIFALIVFCANLFSALAHWGYLWKYVSTDLKGSVFAFMGATTFSCLTYILIIVFLLRNRICNIINKLLEIYRSRKYFVQINHKFSWKKILFDFIFFFKLWNIWLKREIQWFSSIFVSGKQFVWMALDNLFQAILADHGNQYLLCGCYICFHFLSTRRRIQCWKLFSYISDRVSLDF